MAKRLEDEYTWEEICDKTIIKIRHGFRLKGEEQKFRKWFMEREIIGYRFDPNMWLRCFKIWQELHNNLDHFIVISGREGCGKSTFANQIAATVNTNHVVENNCVTAREYIDIMRAKAQEFESMPDRNDSIILDEGTELLSRESLNITNRILTKTFFIQRALKFLVIVCIPNFHMLDTTVRHHRVRTLIEVIAKGKYKCITGAGINTIARDGLTTKEIAGVKLKQGQFWHGSFGKEFPNTLDWSSYESVKYEGIKNMLESMRDDVVSRKMIAITKVAKEVGCSTETIKNMIKRQEVDGKQIGAKWYVTRKAYDKLMTT